LRVHSRLSVLGSLLSGCAANPSLRSSVRLCSRIPPCGSENGGRDPIESDGAADGGIVSRQDRRRDRIGREPWRTRRQSHLSRRLRHGMGGVGFNWATTSASQEARSFSLRASARRRQVDHPSPLILPPDGNQIGLPTWSNQMNGRPDRTQLSPDPLVLGALILLGRGLGGLFISGNAGMKPLAAMVVCAGKRRISQ